MVAPESVPDDADTDGARSRHTTSDAPLPRQLRPVWELPEKWAAAILASTAILFVAGLAAGVASGVVASNNVFVGGKSAISRELISATTWAGISVVLVLYVALGLLWWNAQGWVEVLDQWRPTSQEPKGMHVAPTETEGYAEDDVIVAVGHLQRTRWLALVVGVALIVTALAAVGYAVGDTVNLGGSSYTIAPLIVLWGAVAALTVLAVSGLIVARLLRHRCRSVLEFDEEGFQIEADPPGAVAHRDAEPSGSPS